ncbi:MAG: DUF192 domain-containing protein [Gammaproteobacteria bacterium]|nr:DUF192 domain-containing protein [Gammaproteobacteria bacterium]
MRLNRHLSTGRSLRIEALVQPLRFGLRAACLILCISIFINSAEAANPSRFLAEFRQSRAIIESSGQHCLVLSVYLAETSTQRAQGLMYIEQMDEWEGMLFTYPQPVAMTMWMKNTYISLDMLFIRQDGTISSIAKNTTPLSTSRISSVEPVPMVLELNAGFTDRWLIEPGNRLLTIN